LAAQYQGSRSIWIEPGGKEVLPALDEFDNFLGKLGVVQASGPVETSGHPFFTPLGSNGRACVNCHQPAWGMSVSAEGLRQRWVATDGKDPVFAAFDGSNCPDLPQREENRIRCCSTAVSSGFRCSGRRETPMARRSRWNSRLKSCATRQVMVAPRHSVQSY
jgi:hypothetical protein